MEKSVARATFQFRNWLSVSSSKHEGVIYIKHEGVYKT